MGNKGRLFKVSTVAVLKWMKAASAQIIPPDRQKEPEGVMINEIWQLRKWKKLLYGFGEPLMGYRVSLSEGRLGTRSDACFKKRVQQVDTEKYTFITDEWAGF